MAKTLSKILMECKKLTTVNRVVSFDSNEDALLFMENFEDESFMCDDIHATISEDTTLITLEGVKDLNVLDNLVSTFSGVYKTIEEGDEQQKAREIVDKSNLEARKQQRQTELSSDRVEAERIAKRKRGFELVKQAIKKDASQRKRMQFDRDKQSNLRQDTLERRFKASKNNIKNA